METTIEYTDKTRALVYSNERRIKSIIDKNREAHKDEIDIVCEAENNEGYVTVWIPQSWIKIKPPKQISDERREALKQTLLEARSRRNKKQ